MRWIYLSPHFDDVVLSCGGMVWEQVQAGQSVEVWTICAGQPPAEAPYSDFAQSLHARWQTGPEASLVRRAEDEAAAQVLGVRTVYYDLPDCIYRRLPDGSFLVNGEDDLWQPLHPQEVGVAAELANWLKANLCRDDILVSPMTLGSHVDHHLVRAAAETAAAAAGCRLAYYADYPYAVRQPEALRAMLQPTWQELCMPVSTAGLAGWQQAIAQHVSQISTFWSGLAEMCAAVESYWRAGGGTCLWQQS
jgi:LmbE family N-acetylglucosaminyl deacetylase